LGKSKAIREKTSIKKRYSRSNEKKFSGVVGGRNHTPEKKDLPATLRKKRPM